VSLWETDVDLR